MYSCNTNTENSNKEQPEKAITPAWSHGIVWYQIFPERFRNVDTTNDPRLIDQKGCWPHELIKPWKVHPWGSDWYKLQSYEKANGHDTHRASSRAANKNKGSFLDKKFFFDKTKATNPDFYTGKPGRDDYHILKQMIVFQMTYPGTPMIYYGDEKVMCVANDPGCRKPMIWEDIDYTYAFLRSFERDTVIVAFNNNKNSQIITLPVSKNSIFENKLNNGKKYTSREGKIKIEVLPKWASILINKK